MKAKVSNHPKWNPSRADLLDVANFGDPDLDYFMREQLGIDNETSSTYDGEDPEILAQWRADGAAPLFASGSRLTKKRKRILLASIRDVLDKQDMAITIRHCFYRLVAAGVIPKTEPAYNCLCTHSANFRREGVVPFRAFSDSTRAYRRVAMYDTAEQMLRNSCETYRKNLWLQQDRYLEIWIEKDAIAGILFDVAARFGVPVLPCRGFPSLTVLHEAAEVFHQEFKQGKTIHIVYCGDHDPSGLAIDIKIQNTLKETFGIELEFRRITVTPDQIQEFSLLTRPPKPKDKLAKDWVGGCVEVDAMPPDVLRQLVEDNIIVHIDQDHWEKSLAIERLEHESFKNIYDHWNTRRAGD